MTDEDDFQLCGSKTNQKMSAYPQHVNLFAVNVWCGNNYPHIFGLYSIENENVTAVTVNSERYVNTIDLFLRSS